MNDPVAVILVVGLIDAIEMPDYGAGDMIAELAVKLAVGLVIGLIVGFIGARRVQASRPAVPGLYPVASLGTAALAFGLAELPHGSGFPVRLHRGARPRHGARARPGHDVAFHQGVTGSSRSRCSSCSGCSCSPPASARWRARDSPCRRS